MILSLGVNLEESTPRSARLFVHGLVLAGTLVVLALLGGPMLRVAFREIRQRRLTIEALFLLTMTGALAASLQSFVVGHGPIYFEVVSIVLVVYSLGRAIGARVRAKAVESTRVWAGSLATCRRSTGEVVAVESIQLGDSTEVRPGEAIAVDGVVERGTGFVSEAVVTGEPFAVVKRPGDTVLAGCASFDATFQILAANPGSARRIDTLLDTVEAARREPISIQSRADRLSAVCLPLIVAVSFGTFLYWTNRADWSVGLFNAMSVLLVACPCALGLATPIVVWSALGRFAERGLVARSGDVVERLASVRTIAFDKTGTLTEEQFGLVDVATFAIGPERARLLGWFALVQKQANHPVARPFADLPRPFGPDVRVENVRVVPGSGIEAIVIDGAAHRVRIGRPEWIDASNANDLLECLMADGHRVDCEVDGKLAAIAMLTERLRDSVPAALAAASNLGLQVEVLTGDRPGRATSLELPNVRGNLLPDEKANRVSELGHALVVGDGINDASALARAHVGVALASGTDLANGAADATLYGGDLRVIPWAVALARDSMRIVRRNLLIAAGYNLIGMSLAAMGILHPVVAALLMLASSLWIVGSATRVGASADHDCANSPVANSGVNPIAFIHASALILQGLMLVSLLGLFDVRGVALTLVFTFVGVASAIAWARRTNLSHAWDMAYGMLTLGNLGMVAGWWADHGFGPLAAGTCDCATAILAGVWKPGMWLGMFVFGNFGMAFCGRRPHRPTFNMYVGGNLGMGVGMALGGWSASMLAFESIRPAAIASYFGMTSGMVLGMCVGEVTFRWLRRIWHESTYSSGVKFGLVGPVFPEMSGARPPGRKKPHVLPE